MSAATTENETPKTAPVITVETEWDSITDGVYGDEPGEQWQGYYDGKTTLTIDGKEFEIPRIQFLLATDSQDVWNDADCGDWKLTDDDGQCRDAIGRGWSASYGSYGVEIVEVTAGGDDSSYNVTVEGNSNESAVTVAEDLTEEDAEALAEAIRKAMHADRKSKPEVELITDIDDIDVFEWDSRKQHAAGILRYEELEISMPSGCKDISVTAIELLGGDKGYRIDNTGEVYKDWAECREAIGELTEEILKSADPLAEIEG